jgi:dethiobiotin synthetase
MKRGLFVTGTDTGVGKTVVACAMLRAATAAGCRSVGMKPVAAGVAAHESCNADVVALHAAGNVDAPLRLRNPYAFAPAIAPHLAAQECATRVELATIAAAFDALSSRADAIVVEGAGGALAPINARCDMLDIAQRLDLAVIMVVGVRLGCLNHAFLTALAIRARGLTLGGWVANCIDPALERREANIATLELRLPAPRIATFAWGMSDPPRWHMEFAPARFSKLVDSC